MTEALYYDHLTAILPSPQFSDEPQAQQDNPLQRREYGLDGAMVIDADALNIGPNNYADLQNLRYANRGLRGVQGYTQINTTTALANVNLRSGIQFIKRKGGTLTSHVVVQAYNAGFTSSSLFLNTTAIPNTGDFETASLFTDSSGAGLGRFAFGPDGTLAYCNGVDTLIWGTDEHRVAAVVNYQDSDPDGFRHDITTRMNNAKQDTPGSFVLVLDGGAIYLLVGSTRPLQGIKFYVDVANTAASTSTVEYWDGTAWAAVTTFSDGTASGGVTLAQTGSMTFDSTVNDAMVQLIDGRLLYYYRVIIGATGTPDSTINLYQITLDTPFQPVIDLWDGVERNPIAFFLDNSGDNQNADYTLEVQQRSFSTAPIDVDISLYLSPNDPMLICFDEAMAAIRFELTPNQFNEDSSTTIVRYWDGTTWTDVDNLVDGTAEGVASFHQSGVISWTPPGIDLEKKKEIYGIQGYWYQVFPGDIRENPSTHVDYVAGITAQRYNATTPITGYKFPFFYRGRLMLAGAAELSEGNRIDYSAIGAPDVHNGLDTSAQGRQLYVGDQEDLTAGIELYNRFGDNSSLQAVLTKARQTWLLTGGGPTDFQLFQVNDSIGCPCPLTMDRADVTFSVDSQAVRNIALWVSFKGPMIFDGSVLSPMRFQQPDGAISSIDAYFDPTDSRFITVASFENARGWYDPQYWEYNVLLPTAGSSTCNAWLVCDLRRRKWFRKVPVAYPQLGFRVIDANGGQYIYGGVDTGRMLRLENGTTWDGTAIAHVLDTADLLPSNSIWDVTLIRGVKALAVTETGNADVVVISHSPDGTATFTSIGNLPLTGTGRYQKATFQTNLEAWSHQFRFSVSTTDKTKAPQLIGLAYMYRIVREEVR